MPTKTVPQGISAPLNFNPENSEERLEADMKGGHLPRPHRYGDLSLHATPILTATSSMRANTSR